MGLCHKTSFVTSPPFLPLLRTGDSVSRIIVRHLVVFEYNRKPPWDVRSITHKIGETFEGKPQYSKRNILEQTPCRDLETFLYTFRPRHIQLQLSVPIYRAASSYTNYKKLGIKDNRVRRIVMKGAKAKSTILNSASHIDSPLLACKKVLTANSPNGRSV